MVWAMVKPLDPTVRREFFEPLRLALTVATQTRQTPGFTDWIHLQCGVGRCVEQVESGRDWVQRFSELMHRPTSADEFFAALKSPRRLRLLEEVGAHVRAACDHAPPDDPFAEHTELDGFGLYAADGHYQAASAHEEHIDGKRRAVGHFFALNMRSSSLRHLDIARPDRAKGKKAEHDLVALKRLEAKALRMDEPTGRKVMLVYDRALIDFIQWYKWKQGHGIYVLTREKDNMALDVVGEPEIDRDDPRNIGVVKDQLVAHSKGRCIRRIIYTDPVSGKTYRFLTNEMTLPPGLLAYLFKRRWDVEKIFDDQKNKLHERKAWGKSAVAKCQQGAFQALTHNLILLLERQLEQNHGIRDEKLDRRRAKRLAAQTAAAEEAGRPMNPLLRSVQRSIQRSCQFIRWLRLELSRPTPWAAAIARLRPLMTHYIS
jgi:hypothetical protein